MSRFSHHLFQGKRIIETTQITTQKTTQKTGDRIIEIIKVNPKFGRSEIAQTMGDISEDGIKYHLGKMKARKIIERVGADKGGCWKITKQE